MFKDCISLTTLYLLDFKTDNAVDMSYMFYNMNLRSFDLPKFITNNVEIMA